MHLWFKRCAKTSARDTFTTDRTRVEGDFFSLLRHRYNIFMVHHETCCGVTTEMNLNEQLVKCRAEWAREVGILNSMKELGLIHVAAESMTNPGVAKGAQSAVEEKSVVLKGQEVIQL